MAIEKGDLSQLAVAFQRWAETAKKQAEAESTPALQFYFLGYADAFALCATKVREMNDPTVVGKVGTITPMVREMMRAALEMTNG